MRQLCVYVMSLLCLGCSDGILKESTLKTKSNSARIEPSEVKSSVGDVVEEWEHGYRTDNVVATRYVNTLFNSHNIGFRFPKNRNDYDQPQVFEFFGKYGGAVISGGGAPGGELVVIFEDVKDRESASRKILAIMPELSVFMEAL